MVLLEGINPVLGLLAFRVFAFPPNALVFSSTFAYILLPFAYDTENLFITHLFWAASLAVMGAGACLFAVAPPKCENNGSTKTVTEPL